MNTGPDARHADATPDDAVLARARRVRLAVFDVDGVLTDGRVYVQDDGVAGRAFHIQDGHGLKALMRAGIPVAILSAKQSPAVRHRMADLGIEEVHQGFSDKAPIFEALLARFGCHAEQAVYTGDDALDLPVLAQAGLAVAVRDAHPAVRRAAHWVTPRKGGRGAARDVCDLVLEAQDLLPPELRRFFP